MSELNQARPTVGLLYPGEMGTALAAALCARGVRVVTAVRGRSDQTMRRSREAGIEMLDSFNDVVAASNIVLSVLPPDAAEQIAFQYGNAAALAPAGAIFVDVNSIQPASVIAIANRLREVGVDCVDAAINGLASRLQTGGTLFLSGARAAEIERLFAGIVRTRIIGPAVGQASTMKMLLAGISKGVCALYTELALLARRDGMLDQFGETTSQIYPGIAALIERMLPTYAQHGARRATEMSELRDTVRAAGLQPCVVASVHQLHEVLADAIADGALRAPSADASSVIEQLNLFHLLAVEMSPAVVQSDVDES